MGQPIHLLLDRLVIAWRQSKWLEDDDSLANLRMTVAKKLVHSLTQDLSVFGQGSLTGYEDMRDLSSISSSIHKDCAWHCLECH